MATTHDRPTDLAPGSSSDRPSEASTSELVGLASEQITRLARQELALAQAEMVRKGKRFGLGGGLFGGAGVVGFVALQTLAVAAIAALALVLPVWGAALVVTAVLCATAGAFALSGRKQLGRAMPPAPEQAIDGVKADVAEIKERTHR
ncbi:phage holin family protein [Streptomyces sp. DT24]|uniref:phage holin family protein n=1 Tax=unclassified Streptomyces TaxID=2593676 RepID=UPI0023BA380C|nr:phage holin family protein [Streptomyces sp. AM 4-1-1]WEH36741.1 phage holin family protein [Streptomyces sp. AM 4-1-1]